MKLFADLKVFRASGFSFVVRHGTSDVKAIKEVISSNAYRVNGCNPSLGESWIDIGANCGAFSVWAASFGARVEAFEPDPDNARIARMNIERNGFSSSVNLHELGVDAVRTRCFKTLNRNEANGNLWRNSLRKTWKGGSSIDVQIIPALEVWKPEACIKLDAEGVEMEILEQLASHKVRKLVFEWSFDVDDSIGRFTNVIKVLQSKYRTVKFNGAFLRQNQTRWQSSWFPPAVTVWCFD